MGKRTNILILTALMLIISVGMANAEPYIYVTNHGTDTNPMSSITVLDAEDDTVEAIINDVSYKPLIVAFSPDGKKAYVPNLHGTSVTIIDTNTRTKAGTIDIVLPEGVSSNDESRGFAITPDGKKAYVTYFNSRAVVIIDLSNNEVIGTINNFNDGSNDYRPYNIAFTPDGKKAYVTCNNGAFVIDATTNTVIKYMPKVTYYYCLGVAISPDGKKAYLQDYYLNGVIIDTTTDAVIGNLPGSWLWADGIAVSPDGNKAYITNYWPQSITVIDLTTNTIIKKISGISYPGGIAFQPLPKPVASVEAGDDQTVNEGDVVSFSGSYTGAGSTSPTVSWEFGDGSTPSDTLTSTHAYADNGEYTVTLTVTDDYGASTSDTLTVTVNNVAPVVDAGVDAAINEAGTFMSSGSFNDPGADTWTATVNYGDGSGSQALLINLDKTFGLSHIYADDTGSPFTVTVTVTDDDGGIGTDTLIVTVNNVPPVISEIDLPTAPVEIGIPMDLHAIFTDEGVQDTHTYEIDWDINSEEDPLSTGEAANGIVEASYNYPSPGVYIIKLTIIDDDGGSVTVISDSYVVVYDPEGGFVTGGGWIDSPTGAYIPDTTLAGKATFGFVSKYQKGATVPTGNTEFQFKVADLNFKSTSYDWLVVAGSKAQYKGTGTINGAGNYGFMLSAIDAELTSSADVDTFRIKIWDKASGEIVYDNQIGASEDAEPTTAIGGGSIVVHKVK